MKWKIKIWIGQKERNQCVIYFFCRSRNCQDINECAKNDGKGDCDYACTNTAGSFHCSCPAGFYLGADGVTCHDINECQVNNGNCSQKCVNRPGNHSCACFDGYVNSGPNGTDVICIDIGKTHCLRFCVFCIRGERMEKSLGQRSLKWFTETRSERLSWVNYTDLDICPKSIVVKVC